MEDYKNLIGEHDLATELRLSVWTLRSWRRRSYGPEALKMGKRVMYRNGDVRAFIATLEAAS